MKTVCVSFLELYKNRIVNLTFGGHIKHYSDVNYDYYDLIQDNGVEIGVDGEQWKITHEDPNVYRMLSVDTGNVLYLTQREYDIAVFE